MSTKLSDPSLDPEKTEAKLLAIRIFMHAKTKNMPIFNRIIAIINNSHTQSVIHRIRAELSDILLEIDIGSMEDPNPYFEAMIRGYANKP